MATANRVSSTVDIQSNKRPRCDSFPPKSQAGQFQRDQQQKNQQERLWSRRLCLLEDADEFLRGQQPETKTETDKKDEDSNDSAAAKATTTTTTAATIRTLNHSSLSNDNPSAKDSSSAKQQQQQQQQQHGEHNEKSPETGQVQVQDQQADGLDSLSQAVKLENLQKQQQLLQLNSLIRQGGDTSVQEIMSLLAKHGCLLSTRDERGYTAFMVAAEVGPTAEGAIEVLMERVRQQEGQLRLTKLLNEQTVASLTLSELCHGGGNGTSRPIECGGLNVLMIAAQRRHAGIVRRVIDAAPNVNANATNERGARGLSTCLPDGLCILDARTVF